ncbi:MAG: PilZ domain-containing protein [Desulfobulbaceae bacterium]|nr:MAG: PilZ domain-containing protein [Desulfobulbaceae bacterium]
MIKLKIDRKKTSRRVGNDGGAMEQDRRKATRTPCNRTFQFERLEQDSGAYDSRHGVMLDFSAAGIRFVSDKPLEKNSRLRIRLDPKQIDEGSSEWFRLWDVQKDDQLNMQGKVMWCMASGSDEGGYEIGTCFVGKLDDLEDKRNS